MSQFSPKIDAYIAKSAEFAKPILEHLRQIIHDNCPDVEEKMKWSMPFFDFKGEMMCHIASFKQHCALGFWKASLMKDTRLVENAQSEQAMGHLGRITSIDDLPSDETIGAYVKEAMLLNENGIKIIKAKAETPKEIITPSDFEAMLEMYPLAGEHYRKSSYSFKKEYIMWIEEAKTEATRKKRMEQAIAWISEGKGRNWKYER